MKTTNILKLAFLTSILAGSSQYSYAMEDSLEVNQGSRRAPQTSRRISPDIVESESLQVLKKLASAFDERKFDVAKRYVAARAKEENITLDDGALDHNAALALGQGRVHKVLQQNQLQLEGKGKNLSFTSLLEGAGSFNEIAENEAENILRQREAWKQLNEIKKKLAEERGSSTEHSKDGKKKET